MEGCVVVGAAHGHAPHASPGGVVAADLLLEDEARVVAPVGDAVVDEITAVKDGPTGFDTGY